MEMFEFGSGLVSPFKESVPKRQMHNGYNTPPHAMPLATTCLN